MNHGNTGKQNAAKPDTERARSFLHIRVKQSDKAHWVKQAQAGNRKLAAWAIEKLNAE